MPDAPEDRGRLDASAEASALAELALCENLSQISGWAAKWSAELTRADAALLWAPDSVNPLFLSGARSRAARASSARSLSNANPYSSTEPTSLPRKMGG